MRLYIEDFSMKSLDGEMVNSLVNAIDSTHFSVGNPCADVSKIPAAFRRRLTGLGRLAFLSHLELNPRENEATIWASSWGDISRAYELIKEGIENDEVSPMTFTASVHNAIGGISSIALKNVQPYRSLSAGSSTFPMGLMEAYGELTSGEKSVILVRYEDRMPNLWFDSNTGPQDEPLAYALRLSLIPTPHYIEVISDHGPEVPLSITQEAQLLLAGGSSRVGTWEVLFR